ncbi:hypothetical protein N665_0383s0100 [Sinapis alba]|nr:hypothetical protein N665_0383s0100 [Sinapis alba]
MEKEKSDNSEMFEGNTETWNSLSNGDSGIKPVMVASSSWPLLSEAAKAAPCPNKSSTDSFKSLCCDRSLCSPRNVFVSLSHVRTQNQNEHQHNTYKNQNVSYHPHQSQGGRHNQEHVNIPRNFTGRSGFSQPILVPSFYAQHMQAQQFYNPIAFTDFAPPLMYHPHRMPFSDPHPVLFPSQNPDRMPFNEPPPVLIPFQEAPLKIKILNQVQYYLSEDNLPNDVYLRKRMNDEGFVHIELIAGFSKLKALTSNIQLILDSLQGSDMVEMQGYEIRNRRVWRKYVMPHDWRVAFYPSPEYAVVNNHQNMQLEQN